MVTLPRPASALRMRRFTKFDIASGITITDRPIGKTPPQVAQLGVPAMVIAALRLMKMVAQSRPRNASSARFLANRRSSIGRSK